MNLNNSNFKTQKEFLCRNDTTNNWFTPKFRIITNNYNQYEVQIKRWWFPFWVQYGIANSFSNIEKAKELVRIYRLKKK